MLELCNLDTWVPQSCLYFFLLFFFIFYTTVRLVFSSLAFIFFLKQGSAPFYAMMKAVVRYGMASTALGGGIRIAI